MDGTRTMNLCNGSIATFPDEARFDFVPGRINFGLKRYRKPASRPAEKPSSKFPPAKNCHRKRRSPSEHARIRREHEI